MKGQSEIIASILIVLIAIGLLSVALNFGLPLIQKNQDRAIDDRTKALFDNSNINSIPSKIKLIANNGGQDTIKIDAEGVLTLNETENSISFNTLSRVASNAQGIVSLTGDSCQINPNTNKIESGILGLDELGVICIETFTSSSDYYDITYKLYIRELEDVEKKNGFRIDLKKHTAGLESVGGNNNNIRLQFSKRNTTQINSKTLIITDITVLLI